MTFINAEESSSVRATPVVRCASSQIIKSNSPNFLFTLSNFLSALWQLLQLTGMLKRQQSYQKFVSHQGTWTGKQFSLTFVEAGKAKSTTLKLSVSSPLVFFFDTSGRNRYISHLLVLLHLLTIRAMLGLTKKLKELKKEWDLYFLFHFRQYGEYWKFLPVPQAIINLPRSAFLKYSWAFSRASRLVRLEYFLRCTWLLAGYTFVKTNPINWSLLQIV